jgi:WD40 repeat protein/transcriptional regulator with XRE-family HTH domain
MGRKDKNIQNTGPLQMGSRMRLARQTKSLSLTEMSRRVKYTVTYLSAIENGNGRPSQALVEMYERELGMEAGGLARTLEEIEEQFPSQPDENILAKKQIWEDWGEVPEAPHFYGREIELAALVQSIVTDKCRIVAILGIGGVGKTSLTSTLAHQTKHKFEYIFCRSLQSMPPLKHILERCILFISDYNDVNELPRSEDEQISLLIEYLRKHRCLLVLDNFESVLQGRDRVGQYKAGYENYGRLLQRIGESKHQSCLVLTSREKPKEIVYLEGTPSLARSFTLSGIGQHEAQKILREKELIGSEEDWSKLIDLYSGNPLSLKLIAEPIREVFGGDISTFLLQGEVVFGDIYELLAQQIHRLSRWEREILYWLAIERVALSLQELQINIVHSVPKGALPEAIDSLKRRSMIMTHERKHFTLHPVVMEYITSEFVEQVYQEIIEETLIIFDDYPLIKAQSKDYVRNTQKRLILEPLADHLLVTFGKLESKRKLKRIVSQLQKASSEVPGYATGNLLNLLVQLHIDLRHWDFSHLVVRQAYLRGAVLPSVNFSYADLATTVFTETFGSILSVAFSINGQILAAGTVTGEIRTWLVPSNVPAITFQGHTNWVWSVAFAPNERVLASGSDDRTVRLWEVSSGRCLKILEGHTDRVRSVAFSPDGGTLASGSEDGTVRLWEVSSGRCLKILEDRSGQVYSVAFSPDGQFLASGSDDQAVRLWEVSTGQCLDVFKEHISKVYSVAFSPDGQLLASGSDDQTVRLWEMSTGQCLKILEGQGGQVYTVAFNSDGQLLASGSEDGALRLWEVKTGLKRNTLREHTNRIYALAFSQRGLMLASGSNDQTVRLWDIATQRCLNTLQGYTNLVWSVAFSQSGQVLASGSNDQTVQLWDIATETCLGTLEGHNDRVRAVAFNQDGRILASGSEDRTVRIWEVSTGQCLEVLEGHNDRVRAVAFSPHGQILASGSEDQTVRIWEVSTGRCINVLKGQGGQIYTVAFNPNGQTLASGSDDGALRLWEINTGLQSNLFQGHSNKIYAVAFSPDGQMLASGSNDQTVKLWDVNTGRCIMTLQEHSNRIYAVAFSPDGQMLASGSNDQTVKLWDVNTGYCLATFQERDIWIYSIAFSPDGRMLASGGNEGKIELWDIQTRRLLRPLKSERPYEGMDITGVRGLAASQRTMLKALGAIENVESRLQDG